jgi:hypothetical protein
VTVYTYSQLEGLWTQAGGSASLAPLMAAIAEAESGGNDQAVNATDNGGTQTSWGLWQISNGTHSMPVANILSGPVNAQQAVAKVKSQGLSAWGTYDSGAYKQYLNGSVPATLPTGGASTTAATAGNSSLAVYSTADCIIGIPNVNPIPNWIPVLGQSTGFCLMTKSEARGVLGAMLLAGGFIIGAAGVTLLAAFGLQRTGALGKAADAAAVIPGAQPVAAGLAVAHSRATRTGSQAAGQRAAARAAQRKAAQQQDGAEQ